MKRFLQKLITHIENAPLTLASFLMAFFALIIARLTVENTLALFEERSFFFLFFEFAHTFLFFLCSFILLLPIVKIAGATDLKKQANILLFGFLIILTPPIVDTLYIGRGRFWSFYEFDGLFGLFQRFFTLFGDTPDIGITYGVRVEVVLVTLALGLYAYCKSKHWGRSLFVALLTYSTLFVLGTFPSWITLAVLAFQKGLLTITSTDVAALFLAPENVLGRNLTDFRSVLNFKMSIVYAIFSSLLIGLFTFRKFPQYFRALWKNARLPQLSYHAGLLFLGMVLALIFSGGYFRPEFFHILSVLVLLIAVECAWLASVIVNDFHDTNIDSLTNPTRPLIQETIPRELYATMGVLFFITSLFFAGIVNFSALLLILSYQALAYLYSAPPLRLKKYPLVATCIAACAGILVLATGFVAIAPTHTLASLPLALLFYLFVAYLLILPIKDFKDVEGDAKDHIYTLPVLLGKPLAKHILGSLLFFLFAFSPLVLHMRSLFFFALFFGSLAFFALQKGTDDETSFFAFCKLPAVILSITALYGITITFFLL